MLRLKLLSNSDSEIPWYALKGKIFKLRKILNSQSHFLKGVQYGWILGCGCLIPALQMASYVILTNLYNVDGFQILYLSYEDTGHDVNDWFHYFPSKQ